MSLTSEGGAGDDAGVSLTRSSWFRWLQLVLGIACMALVANLQYGWTLFVNPIQAKYHLELPDIQFAFTIFVFVETWLVPIEGWLVDKLGPRPVIAGGAILAALGWILNSRASTLSGFYAAAVISGLGAGCVYGTCVGNALKWFPDRRGLAAGLTAAGFGAGSALTVVPIATMIRESGYQDAFHFFGILQGACIFLISVFMVRATPPKGVVAAARVVLAKHDYTTFQMVSTPVFWVMYALFVAVAAGGLMITAQIGPMAKDWKIADLPVQVLGYAALPLLTLTVTIDNLANGLTRPLCGFISDRIGRENTMFVVFMGEGLALLGLAYLGRDPLWFAVFAALNFLCWGEIFSIFPALCADTFGAKYAAANAGTLYTAKGAGALFVLVTSEISAGGHWDYALMLAAGIAIAAGIAARVVLHPMRRDYINFMNTRAYHSR